MTKIKTFWGYPVFFSPCSKHCCGQVMSSVNFIVIWLVFVNTDKSVYSTLSVRFFPGQVDPQC